MYIEFYMGKRKLIILGRRRSRQENNVKMDLKEVEGGWRMDLTHCPLQHQALESTVVHLGSAVIAFFIGYRQ
jgi:hypothetical protein